MISVNQQGAGAVGKQELRMSSPSMFPEQPRSKSLIQLHYPTKAPSGESE
jgi:hypothetical protein